MNQGRFFVYILASRSRVLYTGVTRDLLRRVHQHRKAEVPGFSRKYREKKLRLIDSVNAGWRDLAEDWFPRT
jgi:putative endonuclease